jgi:hypothetical protein
MTHSGKQKKIIQNILYYSELIDAFRKSYLRWLLAESSDTSSETSLLSEPSTNSSLESYPYCIPHNILLLWTLSGGSWKKVKQQCFHCGSYLPVLPLHPQLVN